MDNSDKPDYVALYERFKGEKQYLQNVSPATTEGYRWAWKAFKPIFDGLAVGRLDFMARIATLRDDGLSPVTINTYLRSMNTFLRGLHVEGLRAEWLRIPRLKEE